MTTYGFTPDNNATIYIHDLKSGPDWLETLDKIFADRRWQRGQSALMVILCSRSISSDMLISNKIADKLVEGKPKKTACLAAENVSVEISMEFVAYLIMHKIEARIFTDLQLMTDWITRED